MNNELDSFNEPNVVMITDLMRDVMERMVDDTGQLLRRISQDDANVLCQAFNAAAHEIKASNPTAMWALAILTATVFASVDQQEIHVWMSDRFKDMVSLAFPAVVMEMNRAKRRDEGVPRRHDA